MAIEVHSRKFEIYLSEAEIQKRIHEMAAAIDAMELQNPMMIAVLNGSVFFSADLMKALDRDMEISFIKVSSYQGTTSSGKLDYQLWPSEELIDRDVLLVEDIVDTGFTVQELVKKLHSNQVKSVRVITLLNKEEARKHEVEISMEGFKIPDKFVLGYGLDFDGLGRGLRDIYQLIS